MNFLKNLFGNLNLDVNKLVDELHSSPVEKKELKIKFKEILTQAEGNAQEQVTRRWEADSKAGWLPANIRPLTLAFLVISTIILIFIEGGMIDFEVSENWIDLLTVVMVTVIGAYFGGRSFEKFKKK